MATRFSGVASWVSHSHSMKISVLTVCWNSVSTIQHTIESFIDQKYPNKEMLIIDGGSTDGTVDLIRTYERDDILISSEPDQGMYDALNKGLRNYRGDAVGALNADDTYHDDTVLEQIAQTLSTCDMMHGSLNFVKDHGSKEIVRKWQAEDRPRNGFKSGWMPAHPTFYVKRKVVEAVGEFDLNYMTASDYDWMLRAVDCHGFQLGCLQTVMVDMMQGGKSTSWIGAHIHHNYEALKARRKWLGAGIVDYAALAKPLRKVRQFTS